MIGYRHSRGMALVFSLVILTVLTILGAAVMSGSGLELRMSSNALDKTVSFNDAEDLRGQAEAAVNAIVDYMEANNVTYAAARNALGYGNGFYDNSAGGEVTTDVAAFWDTPANYRAVGASGAGYVVQYLGVYALYMDRTTAPAGNGEQLMHVFRLTVLGRGATGAMTAVQAVYMRN